MNSGRSKIILELSDPRRHIGLHTMQSLGSASYPAFAHHRAEDTKLG
jgi:hypothetical protein